jgi:NADPH-dependent curcumin reductase CurA
MQDFLHCGARLMPQLPEWLDAGKLVLRLDEATGLENLLTAYPQMLGAKNTGKCGVRFTY